MLARCIVCAIYIVGAADGLRSKLWKGACRLPLDKTDNLWAMGQFMSLLWWSYTPART